MAVQNYILTQGANIGDNMTDLIATTLSKWIQRNFVDQVFQKTPTLDWVKQNQELIDGGESLTVPISYGINTAGTFYEALGIIPPVPQKQLAWAMYVPCEYVIPIAISQRELDLNAGDTAMARLLDMYMQNALDSAQNTFATVVYQGTTYNALAPKGIIELCDNTASFGGINPSTYTWWTVQTATATNVGTLSSSNLIEQMMVVDMNVNVWKRPTDTVEIFMPFELYRKYFLHLQPTERRTNTETLREGPKRLLFGESEIIPDAFMATGAAYWLTRSAYRWATHRNANWKAGKPQEPQMQTAVSLKIRWMGAAVCEKRRAAGKLSYTL